MKTNLNVMSRNCYPLRWVSCSPLCSLPTLTRGLHISKPRIISKPSSSTIQALPDLHSFNVEQHRGPTLCEIWQSSWIQISKVRAVSRQKNWNILCLLSGRWLTWVMGDCQTDGIKDNETGVGRSTINENREHLLPFTPTRCQRKRRYHIASYIARLSRYQSQKQKAVQAGDNHSDPD